ncbi:MAG TPA: rhomboid family intramembrane serine protease [Terriglobales bacterium]|nr:rhomboid family intramembrane serine protease [Terriglobales bacterium]
MANCIRCGRQLHGFSFKKICPWCVQHEAAQRGEDDENARQPVMAVPWARRDQSSITLTHVLFGANVAVFLAMALSAGSVDFGGLDLRPWGANVGPLTLTGQWWRLFTYMFLHGGLMHIGFNMWCLWELGSLCESLYGRWTYAAIYFITGIAAGLTSVAWNPHVVSVGASGAIFGLAGAMIASFYLGEFSLPSVAIKGTLRSLVIFAVFNLFLGQFFGGIDNACHVGGLVSGLIVGALIARFAPGPDALRRIGVLAVVALGVISAVVGVQRWRGAPMRMWRALDSISENDPNREIIQLQAIVKQQPNLAQAHFALAQAYFNREQFPQAESEFKRVVELQPQNADARFNLGITLLNEKRLDDSKAAFTELLTQDPKSAEAHYGLGLTLADAEKYQAAIEEFKTATSLNPQFSGLYYELGNSYAKLNMYDDAIAAYLQEKQKNGDNPDVEAALADAYQAKGMTKQAQEAKNRAAQLRSEEH